MAEYVPESLTSVASSQDPFLDWSDDIPLEVDEDVFVPIWDILHDDLFRQEREVREIWSRCEQQLRDSLHTLHLQQRE